MEKVRTTMRPHEEIEVSPAEAKDLAAMGLLEQTERRVSADTPEENKAGSPAPKPNTPK